MEKKKEKVIVFNSIICKYYNIESPPYYYPILTEYTNDNYSQINNEICNQIQDVFKLKNVDILKEFVDNLSEDKKKLEFEKFIIGGYKTNDKICMAIKTDKNINNLKR